MIAKFLMLTKSTNRMDALCKGETWVLICTDLVARGVDFRVVNMVINYNLPESGITYVHRIGRTGRAGRKGKAIMLFTEADFDNLRTIGYGADALLAFEFLRRARAILGCGIWLASKAKDTEFGDDFCLAIVSAYNGG